MCRTASTMSCEVLPWGLLMTSAPSKGAGLGWRGMAESELAYRFRCVVSRLFGLILVRSSVALLPFYFGSQAPAPAGLTHHKLVSGGGRLRALGFIQQPLDAFHMLLRKIQREVQLRNAPHLQPLD